MDQDQKKLIVARASLNYIENDHVVGIGTGSTVNHVIELLPSLRDKIMAVVSSSRATTALLEQQGFEVSMLNAVSDVDVYIDGADEANKHRQLIKGGGGALTREKILASAARRFVCIIDDSKQVDMLGTFPLPVEVIPMARSFVARELVKLGGDPEYRQGVVTDNGNVILDVHNLEILNPRELEQAINNIPGVVTNGIFALRGADIVLSATNTGVDTFK